MALELQGGQPSLGLAEEVDREKPPGQRQLGAVEQLTGGQRGLSMAGVTPAQPTAATDHAAVGACVAAAADEAIWQTSTAHGSGAAGYGAKALNELGQRHALLELDGVVSHSVDAWVRCHHLARQVAHHVGQA